MHMADALVSPAVGGTMWAATAVTTAYCARKIREENDPARIPLMGVAGAFIFAAQMINFTIPGTGSSGHLGGGLILAILLGPQAGFLVMASVLTVQALFFADGGILSLGANIFNLGFFACFLAYPLVYKPIVGNATNRGRLFAGSLIGAIVALELGALGVVFETTMSGVSALPFPTFLLLMLPIHLAIGVVEGLVTAGVVLFVRQAQPELLERSVSGRRLEGLRLKPVLVGLAIAAVVVGGAVSWFASTNSDGLEWSIARITNGQEIEPTGGVRGALADIQKSTALLPDYAFKADAAAEEAASEPKPAWPAVDAGTSTSGLVGAALVLAIAVGVGLLLRHRSGSRNA